MTMPLGEEFIKIRPDATTFRAELQAQVAAAMTSVQGQIAAAQTQFQKAATAAAPAVTAGGVILPPGVRAATAEMTAASNAQTIATTRTGTAARSARTQLTALGSTQQKLAGNTQAVRREIMAAESSLGRYSRGMVAATAASTGFFRAVSFASGAFLLGATIGASIGAAVQKFSQMTQIGAVTAQLIKSTGGAANVTAEQIDALAISEMKLTGIDDEVVKAGANILLTFRAVRNEVGQGNDIFNRATKAAADISTVFRTDLRGSAVQLGKALQDPVRGVTALRRSGITLSQAQRDLIKQMVESGAIMKAQKLILGEVEHQVGSAAEAIGKTLPGRLRVMREEAVTSLAELVKRLTESKTAAELAAGGAAAMASAWGAARSAIGAVGPTLVGVLQGLGKAAGGVGGAGAILTMLVALKSMKVLLGAGSQALGLFATASAGAARAALATAVAERDEAASALTQAQAAGISSVAQQKKVVALQQAAVATTATAVAAQDAAAKEVMLARSAQRTMATMSMLAGVFAIGAAASHQYAIAALAAGVALVGVAGKALAAARAMRAAGTAVTAMGVASAAIGGWAGAAAIAVAGLALVGYKLWQNWKNAPGTFRATKKALDALNTSLDTNMRLQAAVGTARERVGVARFDVSAAEKALQIAQQNLANTRAAPGSLRYRYLEEQVSEAEAKLRKEEEALTEALADLDVKRENNRQHMQQEGTEVEKLTSSLQKNLDAAARAANASFREGIPSFAPAVNRDTMQLTGTVEKAREMYQKLWDTATEGGKKTGGATGAAEGAILAILSTLNRMPTQPEITFIVSAAVRGQNTNQILQALGIISGGTPGGAGAAEGLRLQVQTQMSASVRDEYRYRQGIVTTENKEYVKLKDIADKRKAAHEQAVLEVANAKDALASARESREAAIEGLADARRNLSDAQQSLTETIQRAHQAVRDAINAGREAVNQAVQDAKSNLLDLNQAVAEAISTYMEKTGQAGTGMNERLRALRQQIIRGGGGPETLRAAQEVNFLATAQTPEVDADKLKRQFDDLTDSFVRGRMNLAAYDKRFNKLTSGIDMSKFREMFGSAAANEFLDTIRISRQQAVAIAQGPQRIGGAVAQKLIKPLDAVRQATKEVAQARRDAARDISGAIRSVGDASRAVTKAEQSIVKANRQIAADERRLRHAQQVETKTNTTAIKANTKAVNQLKVVINAKKALTDIKPKPKGPATKEPNPVAEATYWATTGHG